MIKIIIVYDNNSNQENLIEDWGFSCFIETDHRKILFDTGGNGRILIENLKQLHILSESITDVVISHADFDHIGGLSAFLNQNQTAVVHIPVSLHGIHYPNQVISYNRPTEIYKNVYLTGELDDREQALAVKTDKGFILIVGCGHPGLANLIQSISVFGSVSAIIGGLHGFNDYSILKDVQKVCPTHCTRFKETIKMLYPDKYIAGGAGKVIMEFELYP